MKKSTGLLGLVILGSLAYGVKQVLNIRKEMNSVSLTEKEFEDSQKKAAEETINAFEDSLNPELAERLVQLQRVSKEAQNIRNEAVSKLDDGFKID